MLQNLQKNVDKIMQRLTNRNDENEGKLQNIRFEIEALVPEINSIDSDM